MTKRIFLWVFPILLISIIVLLSFEESRTFVIAFVLRAYLFVKKHLLVLFTTFFLVNGKFILMLFLKKIAFLSATGLGKRYFIEKVITQNLKIHFLDDLASDIKKLLTYIKHNFQDFTLVKQIIAGFIFLGSLGFVAKFMGGMLAMKVFIAKFWSFLLVFALKIGSSILYFFTEYLWGSWMAPLVEIFIFSWVLKWLEKVPILKRIFSKIYVFFVSFFTWIEHYMENIFHLPLKKFFKILAKKIKKMIYLFIGEKRISSRKRLEEIRRLSPSIQVLLQDKRKEKVNKRKHLVKQREARLLVSRTARSRH